MVMFLNLLNQAIPHSPQPQTISLFNMTLLPHLNTSGGQPTIWQAASDGTSAATWDQCSRVVGCSAPGPILPAIITRWEPRGRPHRF
uniref:Uncharacterized protein n=1 Tax=Oryza nivara TaxID=4536 RepID=A0A0E0HY65_ORYNI